MMKRCRKSKFHLHEDHGMACLHITVLYIIFLRFLKILRFISKKLVFAFTEKCMFVHGENKSKIYISSL
jgi:hypothetical protein